MDLFKISMAGLEIVAFPEEGFIALKLDHEMLQSLKPVIDIPNSHALVRFRTQEGFQAFMVAAIEAASMVWPEIAAEWHRGDDES